MNRITATLLCLMLCLAGTSLHATAFAAEQTSVSGPSAPSPATTGIYGVGITGDTLANAQVGGPASGAPNTQIGFKCTAAVTDTLVSFREAVVGNGAVGYGCGHGGTLRVTIQTDDGSGFPSGTILATKDLVDKPSGLPQYSFASLPLLTKGKVYH